MYFHFRFRFRFPFHRSLPPSLPLPSFLRLYFLSLPRLVSSPHLNGKSNQPNPYPTAYIYLPPNYPQPSPRHSAPCSAPPSQPPNQSPPSPSPPLPCLPSFLPPFPASRRVPSRRLTGPRLCLAFPSLRSLPYLPLPYPTLHELGFTSPCLSCMQYRIRVRIRVRQ